jgi:hypothetical protein
MLETFPEYRAGIDPLLWQDFIEIIQLCKANGITLILYDAPEDPAFTSSQSDRALIHDVIHTAVHQYHLPYFDFTIDGPLWHDSLFFNLFDSHHVRNAYQFTSYFINTAQRSAKLFVRQ